MFLSNIPALETKAFGPAVQSAQQGPKMDFSKCARSGQVPPPGFPSILRHTTFFGPGATAATFSDAPRPRARTETETLQSPERELPHLPQAPLKPRQPLCQRLAILMLLIEGWVQSTPFLWILLCYPQIALRCSAHIRSVPWGTKCTSLKDNAAPHVGPSRKVLGKGLLE